MELQQAGMDSKTKTIGLVRHGETDWNIGRRMQGREDIPLNDLGRKQSLELGRKIADQGRTWDMIISSPLQRALETAQTINSFLGMKEILIMDQLIERDFGMAAGLTRKEVRERYPDGLIPGMESTEELTARVLAVFQYIFNEIEGNRIILVTHGEVMRTIYRMIGQPHKVSQKPENASIDIITVQLPFMFKKENG